MPGADRPPAFDSLNIPVALLIREHGAHARPADIVSRLRCSACGAAPPIAAELVDEPQREAPGYAGGRPARRRKIT